jgi:hypothetical protein
MLAAREVGDVFFLLGFLAIVVGYLMLGIGVARAHLLRIWEALLPGLGVICALAAQDAHGAGIWLGAAWLVFGTRLLRHAQSTDTGSPTSTVPGCSTIANMPNINARSMSR